MLATSKQKGTVLMKLPLVVMVRPAQCALNSSPSASWEWVDGATSFLLHFTPAGDDAAPSSLEGDDRVAKKSFGTERRIPLRDHQIRL